MNNKRISKKQVQCESLDLFGTEKPLDFRSANKWVSGLLLLYQWLP